MPEISVVMPVYNGEKYLQEQLDSILAQTYPNIEILIRDDGSKDATLEILEEYAKKQKRINWIITIILLVFSLFFLFPVIWMLANSFKPDAFLFFFFFNFSQKYIQL